MKRRETESETRRGFRFGCVAHAAALFGVPLVGMLTSSAIGESAAIALTLLFAFFLGISQLSYMIPLLMLAKLQQRDANFFEGLIFSGAIPIVLSAAIYATAEVGLWRIHL